MSKTKLWTNLTLEDLLRVDSFGQQIEIHDPIANVNKPLIQDNREFFTQIYSDVSDNEIEIDDGNKANRRKIRIDDWLKNEITTTDNSLVVFIEGYAGCGKSTLVQYLLSKQLKTYNYDYNYYNYDIGAYYDNSNAHRIAAAIREGFIQQLMNCIKTNNSSVIEKFKELAAQYNIRYLDTSMKIFYEFVNTLTFKEAIFCLQTDCSEENSFRAAMYELLKDFSCEEILTLDYVFRLSAYIVAKNHDDALLYICYDNMDSIENFDDLNKFDNTLVALRKNIDDYINKTYDNYQGMPIPRFVIMATYRKITAAKVELSFYSERVDDYAEYNQYIQYVDASHAYSYYSIISNRKNYFSNYIMRRRYDANELLNKLSIANNLTKMEFVRNRYAGLWNNNYRTCSTILHKIFVSYFDEAKICIDFVDKKIDGYDEEGVAYLGASAIFLSLVCKIFNKGGLWGEGHMKLIPLSVDKENKSISELTSLSRLILTYISNNIDSNGKRKPVSTLEIFKEFGDLFSPDEICKSLANMLARDKTDTWRRPIYYHRNAISDNESIEFALKRQWNTFNTSEHKEMLDVYTEVLLCDCGSAYIERLMSEFDFFSNRLSNDNKSLYLLWDVSDIKDIIDSVYNAVRICCQDMVKFCHVYMEKKSIKNYREYIGLAIHPRTNSGKPQLHTERIIFSHIAYLDHCRRYHISQVKLLNEKKTFHAMYIQYISKYLELYSEYIAPISTDRKKIAEDLWKVVKAIENADDEEILLKSISSVKD